MSLYKCSIHLKYIVSSPPSYLVHAVSRAANIRRVKFDLPASRRAIEHGNRESQSGGANELPGVERLDGKVKMQGQLASYVGMYWEVWEGVWKRCDGEEGSGGESRGEMVGSGLTNSISY